MDLSLSFNVANELIELNKWELVIKEGESVC
jgi:hypothetical protein